MSSTADKIMDLAQDYIQTRGYNAFSYKDLAHDLGIKTASIHYHFPKKADLGVALVQRYISACEEIYGGDSPADGNYAEQFRMYISPFLMASETGIKICLCGALSGEISSLPKNVQDAVRRFISFHESWLTKLLEAGKKDGAFTFTEGSPETARFIFSALEGALTIARAQNRPAFFSDTVRRLESNIGI